MAQFAAVLLGIAEQFFCQIHVIQKELGVNGHLIFLRFFVF
jgi:hypothetical protein